MSGGSSQTKVWCGAPRRRLKSELKKAVITGNTRCQEGMVEGALTPRSLVSVDDDVRSNPIRNGVGIEASA
jgi:hypothetical protein